MNGMFYSRLMIFASCAFAFGMCGSSFGQSSHVPEYDRDRFGGWIDNDDDCRNTRHELLAELSTLPVTYSEDGCRVEHGRWNDPYTGIIFVEASDLDIDHLVPLNWAWQHGAWRWSEDRRIDFANDPINLFAVDDGTNRAKGADGPLSWLPPNENFQCQYILRFWRVVLLYRLEIEPDERVALTELREELCQ